MSMHLIETYEHMHRISYRERVCKKYSPDLSTLIPPFADDQSIAESREMDKDPSLLTNVMIVYFYCYCIVLLLIFYAFATL